MGNGKYAILSPGDRMPFKNRRIALAMAQPLLYSTITFLKHHLHT